MCRFRKNQIKREVICMRKISLLCITLVLTGCWDTKELNELAVATGLAIDKAEDGYQLSVQLVNPSEISPQANASGIAPVTVRTKKGETMYDSLRRLSLTNSRRIYTSHLRLLVISEDVAKEGIEDILDFLSRDKDFRTDFFIVIARGSKAGDILKIQTITEKIPGNALYSLLKNSGEIWAETVTVNLGELLNMLTTPGKSPVLSGMEIQGDLEEGETKANTETTASPAGFNYVGLGVFHKHKLIGWLSEEEGKDYNYITDGIKNTVGHLNCPGGGKMSIEIMRSKSKQSVKISDDIPRIGIDLRADANIGETDCLIDVASPKELQKIETLIEKEIIDIIDETVERVQKEYMADIFGFGETIYRTYPKIWKRLTDDWEEHFANLEVRVNVKVNIHQTGTIGNSYRMEMKEQK